MTEEEIQENRVQKKWLDVVEAKLFNTELVLTGQINWVKSHEGKDSNKGSK